MENAPYLLSLYAHPKFQYSEHTSKNHFSTKFVSPSDPVLPLFPPNLPPRSMVADKKGSKEAVTREYTINLHKRLMGIAHKKRAPRALREIKKFAQKAMGTKVRESFQRRELGSLISQTRPAAVSTRSNPERENTLESRLLLSTQVNAIIAI